VSVLVTRQYNKERDEMVSARWKHVEMALGGREATGTGATAVAATKNGASCGRVVAAFDWQRMLMLLWQHGIGMGEKVQIEDPKVAHWLLQPDYKKEVGAFTHPLVSLLEQ
jgi:hypothetical protein